MERIDYLEALRRETSVMQSTVARSDLGFDVPTCPGWTTRDLVVHTGQVHRHKTASVRDDWRDGPPPWPDEPEGDVIAWFDEGIGEMLAVFGSADLDAPTWTWCPHDHTTDWWVRRMAHETLIHGADAVIAAGGTPGVDEALAQDGIDEVLVEMIVGAPVWAETTVGNQVVELVTPGRSWFLRTATIRGVLPMSGRELENEPGLVFSDRSSNPDVVISGSAADLNLWLWGRAPMAESAVNGDAELARRVRAIAAEATQ